MKVGLHTQRVLRSYPASVGPCAPLAAASRQTDSMSAAPALAHPHVSHVLFSEEAISSRVRELGAELTTAYALRKPVVLQVSCRPGSCLHQCTVPPAPLNRLRTHVR